MVSGLILPCRRLDLASLTPEKREEVIQQTGSRTTEVVEAFVCGKNSNGY